MAFLLSLLFALSAYFGAVGAEHWGEIFYFLTVFLALGLIPFLDLILPKDRHSATLAPSLFFDGILVVYTFIHVILILWGAWKASTLVPFSLGFVGLTMSIGMVSGAIGLSFAHELIHRPSRWLKFFGEVILVFIGFGHFAIVHIHVHHRYVATPLDPVTARKGQSLYSYFLQVIPGVFLIAWRSKRLKTMVYSLVSLSIAGAIYFYLDFYAVIFFVSQAVLAILLTETAEYIEHYGLRRSVLPNGQYEPVRARHSWDSDCWLTGKLLIHLQRHSDHHLHAAKKYQDLRLLGDARQLPTGYAGCLLVALIPPLWRRMMDHRI